MDASIGQVAFHFGLHRNTLRNLEAKGLIATPERTPGGHRRYTTECFASIRCYLDSRNMRYKKPDFSKWNQRELARTW